MSKHILVTLDGSEFAERALKLAIDLAQKRSLPLHLLQVVPLDEGMEAAQSYLEEKLALVRAAKVEGEAKALLGSVVETILEQCSGAELLVMASHGHSGFDHLILGSVALKIMRRCPVPLLVVRDRILGLQDIKKVLVPLDNYEQSQLALAPALAICEANEATLTLAQVSEATGVDIGLVSRDDETKRMETYLEETKANLETKVDVDVLTAFGSATRCLLNLVQKHDFDLVVMTSHGQGDFNRWVCGSVAENMMRCSAAPVLLVRAQASEMSESEFEQAQLSSTV